MASDSLWSSANNWSDTANPAGKDIVFDDTGATNVGDTVNSIVDTSCTVNSLLFTNSVPRYHTIQINAGQTLAISGGAFKIGVGDTNNANYVTTNYIKGAGTLTFNSPSQDFVVGRYNKRFTGNEYSTLDMSGLAAANIAADSLRVAQDVSTDPYYSGYLYLAATNTIVVNNVRVGSWAGNGTLWLGTTNTIWTDNINLSYDAGDNAGVGTIAFKSGLSNPSVAIRNKAGTGRANLYGGYGPNGKGTAVFDLRGGTADVMLGTVLLGRPRGIYAGSISSGSGSIYLDTGTIDAQTVTLGQTSGNDAHTNSQGRGECYVNGGTFVADDLRLGDQVHNAGQACGYLYIAGGAVQATNIWEGPGTGSNAPAPIRQIHFTTGSLSPKPGADLTVSSAISVYLASNVTKTVYVDKGHTVTINGVVANSGSAPYSGFTKTGEGNLVLNATNTYTGATTILMGAICIPESILSVTDASAAIAAGTYLPSNLNAVDIGTYTKICPPPRGTVITIR